MFQIVEKHAVCVDMPGRGKKEELTNLNNGSLCKRNHRHKQRTRFKSELLRPIHGESLMHCRIAPVTLGDLLPSLAARGAGSRGDIQK